MTTTAAGQNGDLALGQLHDALQRLRDGDFSARLPEALPHGAGMVAQVFNSLATMLENLSAEHIRITEEVGKLGRLGGQMEVDGTSGRWREMCDSLNRMAAALTNELRDTINTAHAWTSGDTSRRTTAQIIAGEIAEMQHCLNAAADRWAK